MTQPIFLIGPRGCGKTTVGHALARARHFQFSDTDHRLQAHEQRTVAEIVQAEGWARFRELETLSLKAVTLPNTVIATGGGIVLAEGNRQFMRENGVVIYLQASVSALIDRLEAYPKAEQRPTLTGKPVREKWARCWRSAKRYTGTLPTILWMPRPRRIGWWSRLCPCCAARRQPR